MTRFLVVPQWQGSPSTRAMTLIDGAEAIAGDLPRSATQRIDVPVEAGEALDTGVRRYSSLARTRDLLAAALESADADGSEGIGVVIGGDCGVAVPAIAAAAARHPRLALVWFDAHGDLHTAETSPSGAFGGMALRAALGDGPLAATHPVAPERTVLVGARDLDPAEDEFVAGSGIRVISTSDLDDPASLADAVSTTGADAVYIHVDLDVLDPAAVTGVGFSVPFGVDAGALTRAVGVLRERLPLAGASISGFAPAVPDAAVDDMGTILRIVGSLA
ncbi:arginase family protein [Microbacterium radiodurans]|uniref:Arginase family protein n=1 Tax=Microbacterium radiodurans TaxID=661398 RepID=A0A5J5IQL9_9MICO|nr:arginase family protein [Microbacterium radiodurans]KAA9085155.1 arginase family protein [Microbacterium radiodurans]